jgi:hypothetical protein
MACGDRAGKEPTGHGQAGAAESGETANHTGKARNPHRESVSGQGFGSVVEEKVELEESVSHVVFEREGSLSIQELMIDNGLPVRMTVAGAVRV